LLIAFSLFKYNNKLDKECAERNAENRKRLAWKQKHQKLKKLKKDGIS
jgi:hypothetical protein